MKNYNIDWSKLSRNFYEEPLKIINIHKRESLCYADILYLVENFSFCDIKDILNVSDNYLRRQLKIHGLKTKVDHRRKYPIMTAEEKEIAKYGQIGLTHKEKLRITYDKNPEIKINAIKNWQNAWHERSEDDELIRQEKIKNTKLEKYGDKNYNGIEKRKTTNLKKYGYVSPLITEEALIKSHSSECINIQNIKRKITYANKSQEEKDSIYKKVKETNNIRYGADSHMQSKEWLLAHPKMCSYFGSEEHKKYMSVLQEKRRETMRKNGTTNTSISFEKRLIEYLILNYSNYTIITQYYDSARYPYNCDCYIKELDLFIEFQGSYFHNWRPFTGSELDIEEYNKMISLGGQRATIAKTWRYRDVQKRETAKKNNLNYLEYWEITKESLPEDPIKRFYTLNSMIS